MAINGSHHWQARSQPHFHKSHRTAKPYYAYVHAPVYPPDERLFKEAGKPRSGDCPALYALQLCADSSNLALHACNGGWGFKPRLELGGNRVAIINKAIVCIFTLLTLGIWCADMQTGYSPFSVARFFLEKSCDQNELTPMKLIKLSYIAHGWHLALLESPLIFEPVQAWKYGPVVESLYRSFKDYGNGAIPHGCYESFSDFPADVKNSTKGILNAVWNRYSHLTALQLSALTHQPGTPWDQVWNKQGGSARMGAVIPDAVIKEFYKQKASTAPDSGH